MAAPNCGKARSAANTDIVAVDRSLERARRGRCRRFHRAYIRYRRDDAGCRCLEASEGIVSKRVGSRYVSGRTPAWLKTKNPNFERS